MKPVFTICVCALLFSCFHKNIETDRLNERITLLEQRIDSLTGGRNTHPNGQQNRNSNNPFSFSTAWTTGRCQAITKKGTQCKRKATPNNYCRQHGG